MLDKTINNALLRLRAQIIRDGLEGLQHVEAMLLLRGIDPASHYVRRKIPLDSCKQRELKIIVLDALRSGPKTAREIAQAFMRRKPEIAPDRAKIRVHRATYKMRDAGVLVGNAGVWRLAQ